MILRPSLGCLRKVYYVVQHLYSFCWLKSCLADEDKRKRENTKWVIEINIPNISQSLQFCDSSLNVKLHRLNVAGCAILSWETINDC